MSFFAATAEERAYAGDAARWRAAGADTPILGALEHDARGVGDQVDRRGRGAAARRRELLVVDAWLHADLVAATTRAPGRRRSNPALQVTHRCFASAQVTSWQLRARHSAQIQTRIWRLC